MDPASNTRIKLRRPYLGLFLVILVRILRRRRLRREQARRRWMERIRRFRDNRRHFALFYAELRSDAEKFYDFCHMSVPVFDDLLSRLKTSLSLQNTVEEEYSSAKERLFITLRYLATGETFASIHQQLHFSISTIAKIVRTTCKIIWRDLRPMVMPAPTPETWLEVAAGFETRASFPNCIGAVGAQHIRVLQPSNSGSRHTDHKKYFSVLVLAVADTQCKFIDVDVGSYDNTGGCRVFNASQIQQKILQDQVSLPDPRPFTGRTDPVPLVMVSNYACAVTPPLLRPYVWRQLDNRRRMFNCRLNRARRCVDCTFGVMAGRWKVFCSAMQLDVATAESVIRACCVLHNYVHDDNGDEVDSKTRMPFIGTDIVLSDDRRPDNGLHIRDSFADYFDSPEGAVTWQFCCLGDGHNDLH